MLQKLTILLLLIFPMNGVTVGQDIVFRMAGNLNLQPPTATIPGPDVNGFDGASFEFEAVFEMGSQSFAFPTFGGSQVFQAQSATLTITGAADGSNGEFTQTDPVLFRPGTGDFGRALGINVFAPALFDGTDMALRASNNGDAGVLLNPVFTPPNTVVSFDSFGGLNPSPVIFADFANNFASISDYGVSNLIVSVNGKTEIILGDVNMDGVVNFLDISPFISLLSEGEFQAEADIDEDESVNFLDISLFIAILSGS